MANLPQEEAFYRGIAAVPPRHRPRPSDTDYYPAVEYPAVAPADPALDPPSEPLARTLPDAGSSAGQLSRPRPRRSEPPPGMVVRRRWRRLRAGAGWTWTGLSVVVFCWGIWAVSVRGGDLIGPVIGLVLVLAVAALLFVLARMLGRAVLEQVLQRERPSAWPSHLTVCVFLVLAGITFLQQTQWIVDSWRWFGDSWQWLVDGWQWLIDLWPL